MMGFRYGSGISWAICKQCAPHSRQITMPTPYHSIFTGRMLFLMPNQQCQSTEGTQPKSNDCGYITPLKQMIPSTLIQVHPKNVC